MMLTRTTKITCETIKIQTYKRNKNESYDILNEIALTTFFFILTVNYMYHNL